MNPAASFTLATILVVLGLLVFSRSSPVLILVGGLGSLMVSKTITIEDSLSGFSNEGVVTIALLFVIAAGLRETGGLSMITEHLLGQPRGLTDAQLRIMAPVAVFSAFMNNTPLVAMLMPIVSEWAGKLQLSQSKLLMHLSYASILGGACTLVGTSTNLIIDGWLQQETDLPPIAMFEPAWVGVPVALIGGIYLITLGQRLLPDRTPPLNVDDDAREYTVEMMVTPDSPLASKTIEAAGLRHLPGLFLMEIERDGQVLAAVSPNVTLRSGDRLVFVGIVSSVVDLQKIRGLVPATDQVYKLDEKRANRALVEAVVSDTCPLVGQTIREGRFRTRYNAVVIALARSGKRIGGKLGDIRLRAGDTLLLETRAAFALQQRNSRDFYLVSRIDASTPPNHERARLALLIVAGMILAVALFRVRMLAAAFVAGALMLSTGCCKGSTARNAIDIQILLTIAAALGIGRAITTSGLDAVLAEQLLNLTGTSEPLVGMVAIFIVTAILAGAVTAKAAVVLVLPIAHTMAQQLGVNFMPFIMAVLISASTTVATPIGYPTNMMVMGPGGYHFSDYMRVGLPLTIIIGIVSTLLIPSVWPF